MDAREFVQKVLAAARIPSVRCSAKRWDADRAVVEITGDECRSELVALQCGDLMMVQVKAPIVLLKIYAPPEILRTDSFLLGEVIDAMEAGKDWEPIRIDWSVVFEELEDCVASELS